MCFKGSSGIADIKSMWYFISSSSSSIKWSDYFVVNDHDNLINHISLATYFARHVQEAHLKLSHLIPFKNKIKPLWHSSHPEDSDAGSSVQVENRWENEQKRRFWVSHMSSEQPERLIMSRAWLKKLCHPNALSIDCLHFTEAC